MKKLNIATILLLGARVCYAQVDATLASPNGLLKVEIHADKALTYTVKDGSDILMKDNAAELQMEGTKASKYTSSTPIKYIKEEIKAPNYKLATINSEYNSCTIKNRNGINVEFRVFNSGVAYRFVNTSLKKDWIVSNEVADFNFTADHTAYLPYSTNEEKPKAMAFQATYDVAPLSKSKPLEAFLPATIDCGKAKVTVLETDVQGYPGIFVKGNKNGLKAEWAKSPKTFDYYPWRMQKYVTATEDYIAKGKGMKNFPWRIMAITHNDTEMPVNTLAYELAEPSRVKGGESWIRPGKVAWDWWNDWGVSGVDFVAGINQQTYKYYIDFASANGLEYIVLDEGWYNPKSGDMLTVIDDINLPELVEYGKQKNVGVILWTVFNVLDAQLDEACKKYGEMGIKGFKVDFMDRYDQEGVDMIYRIADRCAKSKLMLDYHGIFAPQGINRTYPNVINFESVFGMEEVKWTAREKGTENGKSYDRPSKDMPTYDVTFPFIRGMAGYVDYTPGGMRNATAADFQPMYYNPMTMGTRCHQLACYIVHDSPLTMLADNPTIYMKEKECTDFIASLPTVYDEMRCIGGKMGEYIIIARRNGKDWYVGGQTNWDERNVDIDLSFLPKGKYNVTQFTDGINANKAATDYLKSTQTINADPNNNMKMAVRMASGGGFAMKLTLAE
ncbi:MAG: glycoside hydrolase family 97 protein [Bacteroidaceae bacterium]|nr:glycoside hydrolase family 97 protein [Bacteroidaceae bacterium]